MKKLLLLVFSLVSLIALVGCRGESPTLPPPPPPPPKYEIELYGAIHSLPNRQGSTSFVVTFKPRLNNINDAQFIFTNGELKGIIPDPEDVGRTYLSSLIVFAKVGPGEAGLTVRAGRSEKSFNFPVKEIPRCRWRNVLPSVVYYRFNTEKQKIREDFLWGTEFWNKLADINFYEGEGRPMIIVNEGDPQSEYFCDVCEILLPDIPYPRNKQNAAHEIGHAIGMYHSPAEEGPYALMYGVIGPDPPECKGGGYGFSEFDYFVSPSRLN